MRLDGLFDRLLAVRGLDHLVAGLGQLEEEDLADRGVVLRDQDPGLGHVEGLPGRMRCGQGRRSVAGCALPVDPGAPRRGEAGIPQPEDWRPIQLSAGTRGRLRVQEGFEREFRGRGAVGGSQ